MNLGEIWTQCKYVYGLLFKNPNKRLKYGFCKTLLRKNATLTSWTLFSSLFFQISADLFIYSEKATKFCKISTLLLSVCTRDGNSSENFIPRGIEESRNDKFTFLGDRGICYLFLGVLGEFRGMSYPKNPKIPLKIWKKVEKKIQKKFSA